MDDSWSIIVGSGSITDDFRRIFVDYMSVLMTLGA
jgi:hypothetical protein